MKSVVSQRITLHPVMELNDICGKNTKELRFFLNLRREGTSFQVI